LYYQGIRILKETMPKYSIIENVKNLTSKRFKEEFAMILKDLEEAGYNNYWQVLNAKNYGVPQNRERVFIVSIRKDIDKGTFKFPEPFESDKRLKDILEDEVDEKYFLSEKMIKGFIANTNSGNEKNPIRVGEVTPNSQAGQVYSTDGMSPTIVAGTHGYANGNIIEAGNLNNKGWYKSSNKVYSNKGIAPTITAMQGGNIKPKIMVDRIGGIFDQEGKKHQAGSVYNKEGLAPAIDTMQGGYRQPMVDVINATKKGYDTATEGDSINMSYPYSNKKRGRVGHGVAQTLDTGCRQATLVKTEKELPEYKIRRLTPLECWRLMGFDDSDYKKAKEIGTSDTQLYKQAGNSIVVNVLQEILKKLLKECD
jgi:DNA (cytosine-5)-methyltransferase 1